MFFYFVMMFFLLNRVISSHKSCGLNTKISCFFSCFSCLTPLGWKVQAPERLLCSWLHIGWRNTKICIHSPWSKNMVNVENCNLLKINCRFLLPWNRAISIKISLKSLFTPTYLAVVGQSEARQYVLEKNQQGGFRRIWKTLIGTVAMNQAKLVSVIPF